MIIKWASPNPGKIMVRFELPSAIWAEAVYLVGDFNDWDETSLPMTQSRENEAWSITLELDADREYQFRYRVNETEWYNDWHADRYVPNRYGSDNSVVITRLEPEDKDEDPT
ncbi:MAG: isoamylase early set domain-containing protein [Chloroflexi bacterium]|nr:isoamylase early set domain-containing protein [Chloroflexota bacterium]